jgi:hypothetical protein
MAQRLRGPYNPLSLLFNPEILTQVKTGVQMIRNCLKTLDSGFRRNDGKWYLLTFYETINYDELVKSQNWDGKVKSSICKVRKSKGVRRT